MKTLSVRQPWASAIIHLGKNIENRTWTTKYRGPLLIHAALTVDYEPKIVLANLMYGDFPMYQGGIVGKVDLVDIIHESSGHELTQSDWWEGPWGWILEKPEPLEFVSMKGRLGLFDTDLEMTRRWGYQS